MISFVNFATLCKSFYNFMSLHKFSCWINLILRTRKISKGVKRDEEMKKKDREVNTRISRIVKISMDVLWICNYYISRD